MASISTDKGGNRTIQFVKPDGSRTSIRLGKVAKRVAETVKVRVENLIALRASGTAVDADAARWVADLESTLRDKLARVGLVPKSELKSATELGEFLKEYMEGRNDLKPATRLVRGHVIRGLVGFFGAGKDVRQIVPGDADDFK